MTTEATDEATEGPDNLIDLLDRLVEPTEPPPVSMAPETAGWWILGALVLSAVAYGGWRLYLRWRANAYRRAALVELAEASSDPARIATILRRTALAVWPRSQVAGLTGPAWLAFLNSTGGFPTDLEDALLRAPYAPRTETTPDLYAAAKDWIRHHKRRTLT